MRKLSHEVAAGTRQWSHRAAIAAAVALAWGAGGALAGGNGGDVEKNTPVSFTISSNECPQHLAPGTTINGSGRQISITTTRTDAAGITTVINTTHSFGSATDQNGNKY